MRTSGARAGIAFTELAACALAAVALGCSALRQVAAPTDELDTYRRARTASTHEERLHHASEYLYAHPEGWFAPELEPWFEVSEGRFYERHWATLPLLRQYLRILPHGPHADVVSGRIARFAAERHVALRQERERDASARHHLARLEGAAEQRRVALGAFHAALEAVLPVRAFGGAPDSLPAAFRAELSLGTVSCSPFGCTSERQHPYAVSSGSELHERALGWTMGYELSQGKILRVFIAGYGLFDRLAESATSEVVAQDDPVAREGAVDTATTIIGNAMGEALPAARCARTVLPPAVLLRQCDGVALWMLAGPNAQSLDFVELRAEPALLPATR